MEKYQTDRIKKGDIVRVKPRRSDKFRWVHAKDGVGGAVGDLVSWWGKGNVRKAKR
jgi:hypothetical protein